jgi:predicted nucleotidyltransferase
MLTKEEIKIIELFRNDLFGNYTIKELARKINKKSYNWVFNAVKKLNNFGVISFDIKGKSNICSLNLENNLTLDYLSLLENFYLPKNLPIKNISRLIKSIPFAYYTFIVTGSYAEGKETKKSDLDIVILVENKEDSKKVFTILKNEGELMVPPAHIYVFTKNEFLKMLLEKEKNYGKLIFEKRVIIFGAENYYLILREAIENGFKG